MSIAVSTDELEKFHRAVELLEKLGGLFKAGIASAFAVCAVIAGVAVWVNSTSAQSDRNMNDIHEMAMERKELLKDWGDWRIAKDKIDTQLAVIVENQQRQMDRAAMSAK